MREGIEYSRSWNRDPATVDAVRVVAENVRRRIALSGRSRSWVCRATGMSKPTLTGIVHAVTRPSPSQVEALAEALGCTSGDLLDGTDADALWPPIERAEDALVADAERALKALEPWEVDNLRLLIETAVKSPGKLVTLNA